MGLSHPRRDLPDVIELVRQGIFDPLKVATLIADWDEAPDAFMTRTTKVVVARPPYGHIALSRLRPKPTLADQP